jgi:hypothetical protein
MEYHVLRPFHHLNWRIPQNSKDLQLSKLLFDLVLFAWFQACLRFLLETFAEATKQNRQPTISSPFLDDENALWWWMQMLVEHVNQPSNISELQHATEVHSADLPVSVFRRRAMTLVLIVVLIFVASTVSGVLVAINRNAATQPIPKNTFEEFVDSLLPGRYLEIAVHEPLSAQGQALEWLKEDTQGLVMDGWRMLQRYSLSVIYFSLNGQSWFNGSGWLTPNDECSWFQTFDNPENRSCDANGRFSFLMLIKNNLTGSIPDEISVLQTSSRFA